MEKNKQMSKEFNFMWNEVILRKFCSQFKVSETDMARIMGIYLRNRIGLFEHILLESHAECNLIAGCNTNKISDIGIIDDFVQKYCFTNSKSWVKFLSDKIETAEFIPKKETRGTF